jgi:hypothetical protein
MNTIDADRKLTEAKGCGYLVLDAQPTDTSSQQETRLFKEWNAWCEREGRHRVFMFPNDGGWFLILAFRDGPEAEFGYVRQSFADAFQRHLHREPDRDDREAWSAWTGTMERAEALAADLVAVDSQPRDPALEEVFQVHER